LISREKFEFIKDKYGHYASWAVWSEEDEKPKSNVGDWTVLDPEVNPNLLAELKPNVVLVGLNVSSGMIKHPLSNFHSKRSEATDFKIRYAFRDSPYWGGYMTDIIKDFAEKISGNVESYLKSNPEFEKENISIFLKELEDLGTKNPTLIAFGNVVHRILNRNFKDKYKILKVTHYAHFMNKEKYREEVKSIC